MQKKESTWAFTHEFSSPTYLKLSHAQSLSHFNATAISPVSVYLRTHSNVHAEAVCTVRALYAQVYWMCAVCTSAFYQYPASSFSVNHLNSQRKKKYFHIACARAMAIGRLAVQTHCYRKTIETNQLSLLFELSFIYKSCFDINFNIYSFIFC